MSLPVIDEDELQAFVDGRLPEGRSTAVLAHLDRHPAETRRLGQYARHKDELRRALAAADLPGGDPTTAALQRTLALRLTRPDYLGWLRRAASVVLLLADRLVGACALRGLAGRPAAAARRRGRAGA